MRVCSSTPATNDNEFNSTQQWRDCPEIASVFGK